jgi:hypothetical protein
MTLKGCHMKQDRGLNFLFAQNSQDGCSDGIFIFGFSQMLKQIAAQGHSREAFEYPQL